MANILEKIANFEWKKKWRCVAVVIIILIIIIVVTVLLIISESAFKCSKLEVEDEAKFLDYQTKCLDLHNEHRAQHQAPQLQLNATLNIKAVDCAKYYVTRVGGIDHSCPCREDLGENLFFLDVRRSAIQSVEQAVAKWYEEIENYNFTSPQFSSSSSHFTAMVWRECVNLGVGYYTHTGDRWGSQHGMTVVVAIYSPHPNDINHFAQNVFPSLEPKEEEKLLTGYIDSLR